MELRKILEMIWRRKWIIIHAPFVFLITALIVSYLMPSVYETCAKVLVKKSGAATSLMTTIGGTDPKTVTSTSQDQFETDIETYLKLAVSVPVIEDVIDKLQLRSSDGDLYSRNDLIEAIPGIYSIFPKPYVEIEQDDESRLLTITASATDPETAAMLANTVAKRFIQENVVQNREDYTEAKAFIAAQLELIRKEYVEALDQFSTFKIENDALDISQQIKSAISKKSDLLLDKENTIKKINETKSKIQTKKEFIDNLSASSVTDSVLASNPQIKDLKKTISGLNQQLAEVLVEKKPAHPAVVILREKLRLAEKELEDELKIMQLSSSEIENLATELHAQEKRLQTLNALIDEYQKQFANLPLTESRASLMNVELRQAESRYSNLLESLYEVGIAEAMTLSEIQLVEKAPLPNVDNPSTPDMMLNSILGVVVGGMFGIFLMLLVEYLDDTIRSPDDLRRAGFVFLGSIPKYNVKEGNLISKRDAKDPVTESFRMLRNGIKFATLDKPVKTIIVTSSSIMEGRSVAAINLATSFAAEGNRVLLVDGDFRKPSLHKYFNMENEAGVTTILSEQHATLDAIVLTEVKDLSLLPSGPVRTDPGRIIGSERMKKLINELERNFDYVIFDSSPVNVDHDDAIILARNLEGLVYVIEAGRITERILANVQNRFAHAGLSPLGAVLNKLEKRGKKKKKKKKTS